MCYSKIKFSCLIHHHTMQKAAAKVLKKMQPHKKLQKIIATKAFFSLFSLHYSLFFVPLQAIRVSNSYFFTQKL